MPTNYNGTFDILLLADVQCQLLDSFIVHVINYKDYHLINHKSITIMKMELVLFKTATKFETLQTSSLHWSQLLVGEEAKPQFSKKAVPTLRSTLYNARM